MTTRHKSVSTSSASESLGVQAAFEHDYDATTINDEREEMATGESHDDVSTRLSSMSRRQTQRTGQLIFSFLTS
jgi:hypothetical protein